MTNFVENSETNATMTPCEYCGALRDVDDMTLIDGEWVCDDCLEEHFEQCDYCGEYHLRDEVTVIEGETVCDDCRDEHFFFCEECGEYHDLNDIVNINRGELFWCRNCAERMAYQCEDCGEYFTDHRMWTIDGEYGADRNICNRCSEDWVQCSDCGSVVRTHYATWDDDADEWFCDDCYERNHSRSIHEYGYKPTPEFAYRGNENPETTLTFGVELEVDTVEDIDHEDARDTAEAVTDAAQGRVYCKRDGSLDSGFEIVSHPASLAHHMYQMRWANLMRICNKAGYRSHETTTCGLHIHVGRKQLGVDGQSRDQTAANLVILAAALKEELTKFSRRQPSQLNRWASFPNFDFTACRDDVRLTEEAEATAHGGRYQAVNLQNRSTVEFRIFRGTLKRDTFIASIQLVSNMCQYAMTHTPSECSHATFADIVAVHPYNELVSYSRNKRLIATELNITAA